MEKPRAGGFGETLRTVLYAVLIALVVRTFAFEPFNIPSGSMIPTLLIGDYVFVSKYSYGYSRYSLPFSMPLISDRVLSKAPERGDVAVFKLPTDNRTDYIKRLVGMPGDTIQLKDSVLYINGKAVPRERVADFTENDSGHIRRVARFKETLPNGKSYYVLEFSENLDSDNTKEFKVPPGHYFAMGDNRDKSQDSRFLNLVGFVPHVNLVGRAEIRWLSIDGSAWEFWRWPQTLRFGRMFTGIE